MNNEYFLTEKDHHWEIPLRQRSVSQFIIDYAVRIQFLDVDAVGKEETELVIEGPFRLELAEKQFELTHKKPTELGPIFALLSKKVTSAVAHKDGRLEISFSDGEKLIVAPRPEFEAWSVVGERWLRIVCMPGGELAVWQADPPEPSCKDLH